MTNLLGKPKVFPNNFHVWCGRSNRSKNIFRASFRVQQLFKSIQPYYYSISTLMLFFALVDSRPFAQCYRIENSLEFFLNCALCIHLHRRSHNIMDLLNIKSHQVTKRFPHGGRHLQKIYGGF